VFLTQNFIAGLIIFEFQEAKALGFLGLFVLGEFEVTDLAKK